MFGGNTQPQPHQQLNPQPPTTESAEDEALKKNTDCVYFLASPLTCKKGNECEYRHSDAARLNPRDCWYWLNGNCLNPKCAFRHPPLDGLLGIPPPTPVGSASISPQQAAATTTPAGKQGVPCVFYMKGYCLKGDRCPFFHPQFPSSRPVPTLSATTSVNDQHSLQKSSTSIDKSKQVQKAPQVFSKPVELPARSKPTIRMETKISSSNGVSDKYVQPVSAMYSEQQPPNYRSTNVPLTTTQSGSANRTNNRTYQPHVSEDNTPHYKDLDEFSREPSPGFDVLVDDHRDSDYYSNSDQFGRARGHEARNLKVMHDYEIGRSNEYNMMTDVDRDLYHDPRSYERHQYGWEESRLSSERAVAPTLRRHNPRSVDSPEDSDLRNVLAKQRRGNDSLSLRSAVSRDHPRDEDRNYRPPARREAPHKESSVGSRLRGRIKMPGRSISPVNEERGRTRVRYSPEMQQPNSSSQQGRLKDRIKGRLEDDFSNGGRGLLGLPKRLSDDSVALGKRKFPNNQPSDGGVSFEGPKPLSEILKRKRGSESSVLVSDVKESKMQSTVSTTKSVDDDQEPGQEKVKAMEGDSSLQHKASDEEGMINVDEREEGYVEGGEYEDDQVYEEEEYNENAVAGVPDLEEEYIEEEEEADDEDDFAKKMGVMYS